MPTAVPTNTAVTDELAYDELSPAQQLALSGDVLAESFFNNLTDSELKSLPYWWDFWARPKQLAPPGDWTYLLWLAGRGFGKTRAIVEFAIEKARTMPGSRGGVVAATAADLRDILVEGESGFLAVSPPDFMPHYEPSKSRLTWPNGSTAALRSAEKPDRLRGPQFHWAIADEIAAWRFADLAWDMLQFGLRLGDNPQCAIATTPRPIPILTGKEGYPYVGLLHDPACRVVTGTTYENRSNLAQAFYNVIITRYEGTRLGRQELLAHILGDVPGALWNLDLLERTRRLTRPSAFVRIAVGVDPAASTGTTGIVVVGLVKIDGKWHGFVLEDCTPPAGTSPGGWGAAVVAAYTNWKADAIVAESNQGGEMVRHTIQTVEGGDKVNIKLVHASRGKRTRAEPVSSLFEQDRGHMVGALAALEDELRTWVPGEDSPNRLDAMVWAFTELMLDGEQVPIVAPIGLAQTSKWRN